MERPELSMRQAQIVERVARGLPYKVIAAELGISVRTVHTHVEIVAARIPGESTPRHRLTLWFFGMDEGGL
jgi:DNA-binding NarL/FixJ family response regulator